MERHRADWGDLSRLRSSVSRFWRADRIEDGLRFLHHHLFRPKLGIARAASEFQAKFGLTTASFIGVHIRHGDKYKEAAPVSTGRYARAVRELRETVRGAAVFLMSDDGDAFDDLRGALGPRVRVVQQRRLAPSQYAARNGEYDNSTLWNFFVGLELLVRADAFVGTGTSNVGRFVYLSRNRSEAAVSMDNGGSFLDPQFP